MVEAEHPRLLLHQFLSPDLCKELEFIHKSCSTTGYRPNVFSTTLSHLIATNSSHLIIPFVSIRERLKEKVEEFFGCEFELFIEFTGLISWTKGASIGWHSDDNRPYLKQRHFAAVCYLNSYGNDFEGGLFHFQHGEPASVVPMTGDVLIYTADNRNIHSVDEIIDGERLTLTLWFTRDASHDEDAKLISFLSSTLLYRPDTNFDHLLPSPASNNMYWFPPDQASNYQSGFDLRCARIYIVGYDIYCSQDKSYSSEDDSSDSFLELLNEPLHLAWRSHLLKKEFVNILHALQVLQFYYWKCTAWQPSEYKVNSDDIVQMSELQLERIQSLKLLFVKNYQSAETTFTHRCSRRSFLELSIDWASFSAANVAWEAYTSKLHQEILCSFPEWKKHNSIFSNPSKES
ncbi:Procollagen-proline 3-dioxygenase [Heracleum sosnowskyi]|uniref:procollagen-proline 3-dioxygenase n=1 Tax=Heracleum sosnowskyi TaxID=360622 RepID=A0AAD8I8F0_9APIA|nr:Procollagen-proline 3-dioxygenase [Heracleum sosnowskyi]